jgi:hypothetical protein
LDKEAGLAKLCGDVLANLEKKKCETRKYKPDKCECIGIQVSADKRIEYIHGTKKN